MFRPSVADDAEKSQAVVIAQPLKKSGIVSQRFVEMIEQVPTFGVAIRTRGDKACLLIPQVFHQPRGRRNVHGLADPELAARAEKGITPMIQHANAALRLFLGKKRKSPC